MAFADRHLLQELFEKHRQLQLFRSSLSLTLQNWLEQCEWSLVQGEGQNGVPLITLRLPQRIFLGDPFLIDLAEETQRTWGPVDFALFSGETSEPLRVMNQTLLDHRWRWRKA